MRMRAIGWAATLGAVALSSVVAIPVEAQQRPGGATLGYVTAESRYGHGQPVRGPVRRGSHGRLEVRLPGGTWMECGRSCSDTLRRETVDFWRANRTPGNSGDGPGYIQFRF
jgi:hypothetical protein